MRWSLQALDRVIWWTGCYPEQIHGVCHNVYEDYARQTPAVSEVAAEMVDRAADDMIRSGVLSSRWEENSAAQRLVIAALAHLGPGKGQRYEDIVGRVEAAGVRVGPDELWPSVRELESDGVLRLDTTGSDPIYSFGSRLFEEYVRIHYRPGAITGYEPGHATGGQHRDDH